MNPRQVRCARPGCGHVWTDHEDQRELIPHAGRCLHGAREPRPWLACYCRGFLFVDPSGREESYRPARPPATPAR